jgi:hypothetical protein
VSAAEQEEFLFMVAPLMQLQRLELFDAPRLNARVVLVLQTMLPQLQYVELYDCGRLLPAAVGGMELWQQQEKERAALARVRRLLRPGLELLVQETLD